MTINSPAAPIFAMFIAQAEKAGTHAGEAGRHPAERHPEGVPGAEGVRLPAAPVACAWCATPSRSLRCGDAALAQRLISGYHIREAGSTAAQELAFTLATGSPTSSWV
jgi:methylmalonyl-CoA mutase N-terminal domain/subunit